MRPTLPLAVFVLLGIGLFFASSAPVMAQDARTVITVAPYLQDAGEALQEPFLTVYAEGQLCGRLSFDDPAQLGPEGTTELELGLPGQPASCGTDGATLTIRREDRIPLVDTYTLRVGERIVITNFTIPPPVDPGPEPPDAGSGTSVSNHLPGLAAFGAFLIAASATLGAFAARRT